MSTAVLSLTATLHARFSFIPLAAELSRLSEFVSPALEL
jgi:hypothetical protein